MKTAAWVDKQCDRAWRGARPSPRHIVLKVRCNDDGTYSVWGYETSADGNGYTGDRGLDFAVALAREQVQPGVVKLLSELL